MTSEPLAAYFFKKPRRTRALELPRSRRAPQFRFLKFRTAIDPPSIRVLELKNCCRGPQFLFLKFRSAVEGGQKLRGTSRTGIDGGDGSPKGIKPLCKNSYASSPTSLGLSRPSDSTSPTSLELSGPRIRVLRLR